MPPDNPSQPPANNAPGVLGPAPGQSFTGGGKKGINKTPIIIAGVLILVLLVFIVGAVLIGGRKPKPQTNQSHETSDVDPEGPQPAAALDVEQASNSITQDITSLNDDEDFPATKLDSDALDL